MTDTNIAITPDGDLKINCASVGGGSDVDLALCSCLCCAAGNECLHDFMPWGAIGAPGALPPGSPSDYFQLTNQPSGYQSLGRRFDLVHAQTRTIENGTYPEGEDGPLRIVTTTTEWMPRRERYRVAPYGLTETEFEEQFGDGSDNENNAPGDLGGGTGWVTTGLVVIDHFTGQPVLEVWVNPDEQQVRVHIVETLGGAPVRDVEDLSTSSTLSNQIRIQDNTLGGVSPQRCDGVYWARPEPIAFDTLLGEGVWFGYAGGWGASAYPNLPMWTLVLEDDGNDGLQWSFAEESTFAGWQFLAGGGLHSGGVTAYRIDGNGTPVQIPIPGASLSLMASVDGGGSVDPIGGFVSTASSSLSSHAEFVSIAGTIENPSFFDNGYESIDAMRTTMLEIIEACDPGLAALDCPDPQTLDRAAVACDIIAAPIDIVGIDESTRPDGLRRLEITFPQGAEPGSPGSSTFAYWATDIPTLAPRRDGVWAEGVCPEPMLAVACDGSGDTIAFDNTTATGITVRYDDGGGERVYQRTTTPAPGAVIVPDDELTWSDEGCPPPTGSVFERCPDHPSFLPTNGGPLFSPDRVRVEADLPAGVRIAVMFVIGWTEDLPGGGQRVCRATGQFVYRRSADQVGPSTDVTNYAVSSAGCGEIETKLLQSYCRIDGDNRPPDPVEFDLPAIRTPGDVRRLIDVGDPTGTAGTQANGLQTLIDQHAAYYGCSGCG